VNDRFLRVTCPHFYRYGEPGETEAEFTARLAQEVEDLIIAEDGKVAAFIGEPVMAAGGVMPPPEGYWPAVAEVCRRHDVLVICDEVVNGFGRTGNWWGSETVGIQPDMMTVAKQLSSAYLPIGATMMSEDVYSVIAKHSPKNGVFGIGMTYGGHPVCCAVALETLKIYEDDGILDHVRAITPHFQKRLKALGDHPLVGQARGEGLIGAVELVADKETREPFPPAMKAAPTLYNHVAEHGVLCRPLPGDAMGICPPMIVTESEIDEIFDAIEKGLDSAHAALTVS
jgi:4-aminobutyrate--pyruvate transaminase